MNNNRGVNDVRERERSNTGRMNSHLFNQKSSPNLLLQSSADLKYSPHKEDPRIIEKLKERTKKKHSEVCPYHARHSRSRSPRSD